ncbi:hypothetical protein Tco_1228235, partial [Tanacetum coccineum]
MVAYLEKTDGNTKFHQIMDFLTRSSIYYALTISPIVSTSFVEQFWTTATSRTINNISYIDATVAGKSVTISEASIRSDLLFDDVDGIYSLNNQAIFDNIQLMGYEGDLNTLTFNKTLFSPQWKFVFHTMNHCISSKSTFWDQIPTNISTAAICLATNQKYNFSKLVFGGMLRNLDATKKFVMYPRFLQIFLSNQLKDVHVPLDHFLVPTLTKKVLTFMVKKGKNFLGKVTPLFDFMLVQQIEDESEASERPSDSQPYPLLLTQDSGGNHGGQSSNDASLSGNEDGSGQEAKERSQTTYHTLQSLDEEYCTEDKIGKEDFSAEKGGTKGVYLNFEDLDDFVDVDDTLDYMDTEDDQDEGRTSSVVLEEKESADTEVSTEAPVSTVKPNESTDKRNEGTDNQDGGTDNTKDSTGRQGEGTADQNEGKSASQIAPTTTSTPTP